MENIRIYNDILGTNEDTQLPIKDRHKLEINLNQDKDFFYLHLFNSNNFLFTIQSNRRIDLDDYLFINNLKITNDFVKKIYNR